MLAGLNALCEANPFPEIIVGERTSADSGLIKYGWVQWIEKVDG